MRRIYNLFSCGSPGDPPAATRVGETLEVMLFNGVDRPADVAARMEVPPSTAAYRVRLLRELLGPDLHDPAYRLAMMRALRSANAANNPIQVTSNP